MQIEDKYSVCLMLHNVMSVSIITFLFKFSKSFPIVRVKYERNKRLISLKEEKIWICGCHQI